MQCYCRHCVGSLFANICMSCKLASHLRNAHTARVQNQCLHTIYLVTSNQMSTLWLSLHSTSNQHRARGGSHGVHAMMTIQTQGCLQTHRKGAIHNQEEAQDEEAGSPRVCLLQLREGVANGGLVSAAQIGVGNCAEHQNAHKQENPRSAQKPNVTCRWSWIKYVPTVGRFCRWRSTQPGPLCLLRAGVAAAPLAVHRMHCGWIHTSSFTQALWKCNISLCMKIFRKAVLAANEAHSSQCHVLHWRKDRCGVHSSDAKQTQAHL